MQKVSVDLSARQAERLLEQLSPQVKIRLVRRWEQKLWPARFRQLLTQIDQRVRRNRGAAQAALKVVLPARRAFYASRDRH